MSINGREHSRATTNYARQQDHRARNSLHVFSFTFFVAERLPSADRSQQILNTAGRHRDSAARLCSPFSCLTPRLYSTTGCASRAPPLRCTAWLVPIVSRWWIGRQKYLPRVARTVRFTMLPTIAPAPGSRHQGSGNHQANMQPVTPMRIVFTQSSIADSPSRQNKDAQTQDATPSAASNRPALRS